MDISVLLSGGGGASRARPHGVQASLSVTHQTVKVGHSDATGPSLATSLTQCNQFTMTWE